MDAAGIPAPMWTLAPDVPPRSAPRPYLLGANLFSFNRRKLLALGAGAVTATATGAAAQAAPATSSTVTTSSLTSAMLARSLPGNFSSRYATVNGVRLHYVVGGQGAPLFLLHGWPQTWWEYRKVMPALARHYRVIAVDMRGGGDSAKPASGYDKKTMAKDIHDLAQHLGYSSINIAGHDIGAMVSWSLAVNHPGMVDKLIMLDVTHPHEGFYEFRALPEPGAGFHPWWFAFNQIHSLPEALVTGRSRALVDWMFDYLLIDKTAISSFDRAVFAHAYSTPAAIRGGNGWYQTLSQDIIDNATYGQVHVPVLGLVNEMFLPGFEPVLAAQATNLQVVVLPNCGHYFVDEQPAAVVDHIRTFLG
jgi:pimeloyl-ACP methyl ester carboxylesterase